MGKKTATPTPFGVYMRQLRAKHNERLVDMAERLGTSKSYLSYVETGRRNVQPSWIEPIITLYGLEDERETFLRIVSDSKTTDTLDITSLSYEEKRLVHRLVERMPTLDADKRRLLETWVDGGDV